MLFSNFLLSLCFPSIPESSELNGLIDNNPQRVSFIADQEESRLFSKFIKDQCWQKVEKRNLEVVFIAAI